MNTIQSKNISEKSTAKKWIKLSEQRPEHDKLYWVFIPTKLFGNGISMGSYLGRRFCDIYGYVWGERETVTHWKSIDMPEPPMHEEISEIVSTINEQERIKHREYYEKKKMRRLQRIEGEKDGNKLAEAGGTIS